METLRRRWRLVLGVLVVVVAISIAIFSSNSLLQAGSALFAFFIVIALIISSGRRGSGRINPWYSSSGGSGGGI